MASFYDLRITRVVVEVARQRNIDRLVWFCVIYFALSMLLE